MPVISGKNGAVYYYQGLTNTVPESDITFGPNTIVSSSLDFSNPTSNGYQISTTGYDIGHIIQVSGASATANDRKYTVTYVSSGTIGTTEAFATTGTDTGSPIISEVNPGKEMCGFYNWTLNYNIDILDGTNFCDAKANGGRTYATNITDWNATAEKYFLSTGANLMDWAADEVYIRMFTKYVSSPETTNTAHYYSGQAIVTGVNVNAPVDALISQTINFQGKGTLSETVKGNAWTT